MGGPMDHNRYTFNQAQDKPKQEPSANGHVDAARQQQFHQQVPHIQIQPPSCPANGRNGEYMGTDMDISQPAGPVWRNPNTRPLHGMTVELLTTYRLINEIYYKKKASVDYQVKPHETFHQRYDIISSIGKGSFGQVVSAFDKVANERVAIKIIKNKTPFYNQALSEIELLKLINAKDPDCNFGVRMKNTFMYQGHLCIVFELLSINLYDLLRSMHFRGVALPLVKKFAIQLLRALNFLARPDVDIIHCDLKPENILLRDPKRSNIKVIDFGSSCRSNGRVTRSRLLL